MLWNAPIWLNELLVGSIKLIINVLLVHVVLVSLYFLYRLFSAVIRKIRYRTEEPIMAPARRTVYWAFSLVISLVILALFYAPQPVIPDKYTFDSLSVSVQTDGSGAYSNIKGFTQPDQRITIDRERMKELFAILNQYTCTRSLGNPYYGPNAIKLDTMAFNDSGGSNPVHIVISDGLLMRYSAGNTDFIYVISDRDHALPSKVIGFLNRL